MLDAEGNMSNLSYDFVTCPDDDPHQLRDSEGRAIEIKTLTPRTCAYCKGPAEGNYGIHRDGFGEGPEVNLCDGCGSELTPTCEEIWSRIAHPE